MQNSYVQEQKMHQNHNFLGIDIGGTSFKIAILTKKPLQSAKTVFKVTLNAQSYQLYTHTVNDIQSFYKFLEELKKQLRYLKSNVKICGTGGGTMLQSKNIEQLFGSPILPLSEFQASAKGLQFYKNVQFPISLVYLQKRSQQKVVKSSKSSTLKQLKEVLFMSLGSGVNFQLYGQGQKVFQRQKAKDPKLTKMGDGYFLEGTSLGAGFLMGLGRICTGETDYSKILTKMREQGPLRQYYEAFFINLLQMAVNLSVIHNRKYMMASGKLLSFEPELVDFLVKAIKQTLGFTQLQIILVRLQYLQGFLGAIGAIQNILP